MAIICVLPFAARTAMALPEIVATSVQGDCSLGYGAVTVTLDPVTFSAYAAAGAPLWFHFGSIVLPETLSNPSVFALPSGTYTLTITNSPGTSTQSTSSSVDYPVTVPACEGLASLSVRKTVFVPEHVTWPTLVFHVEVTCTPGPTSTGLMLTNANGYVQTVQDIALGSTCTIQEYAMTAPSDCHWITTYPDGQEITLSRYASYQLGVINEMICPCPEGTFEQTFPGTDVKYCCDQALTPETSAFCCNRVHTRAPLSRAPPSRVRGERARDGKAGPPPARRPKSPR